MTFDEIIMLTGEAKKKYQRNYMREYMRNKRMILAKQVVKTLNIKDVKTQVDADGNVMYEDQIVDYVDYFSREYTLSPYHPKAKNILTIP